MHDKSLLQLNVGPCEADDCVLDCVGIALRVEVVLRVVTAEDSLLSIDVGAAACEMLEGVEAVEDSVVSIGDVDAKDPADKGEAKTVAPTTALIRDLIQDVVVNSPVLLALKVVISDTELSAIIAAPG